jgi:hypothetical protein
MGYTQGYVLMINLRAGEASTEKGRFEVGFRAQRVWIWPDTSEIPVGMWLRVTERADGSVKYSLMHASEEMGGKPVHRGEVRRA